MTCMMTGMMVRVTIMIARTAAGARARRVVVVVAAAVVVVIRLVGLSLAILFTFHSSILKPDFYLSFIQS